MARNACRAVSLTEHPCFWGACTFEAHWNVRHTLTPIGPPIYSVGARVDLHPVATPPRGACEDGGPVCRRDVCGVTCCVGVVGWPNSRAAGRSDLNLDLDLW